VAGGQQKEWEECQERSGDMHSENGASVNSFSEEGEAREDNIGDGSFVLEAEGSDDKDAGGGGYWWWQSTGAKAAR
jgi:hypothetical protein